MQLLHVIPLERDIPVEHGVEDHPGTPQVHGAALITLLGKDLGGDVGGSAALVVEGDARFGVLAHTEVSYFNVAQVVQ